MTLLFGEEKVRLVLVVSIALLRVPDEPVQPFHGFYR